MSNDSTGKNGVTAEWIMGTPETQEVVLLADDGEGNILSGNVRHGEAGEPHPWYVTFYDSEESMGFDEQGFGSREEAMLAAEAYFGTEGYAVDKSSRADALIELDEELHDGKISSKDAAALAKVALRSDQGLYNVRTGTVLMPSVDVEHGRVMGIYRAEVKLPEIVDLETAEVTRNAWKHASFYEPDRWHDGEIGFCPAQGEHNAADYIVAAMQRDGSGWCFADPLAIEAKVGLIPDRYAAVQYEPDNLEAGEQPLGWADFLDAAEGNVSYAMSLVDRCDWQSPFTLADEDERNHEVAKVDGKLYVTNGYSLDELSKNAMHRESRLDEKRNEARDAAEALASAKSFSPFAVRDDAIR